MEKTTNNKNEHTIENEIEAIPSLNTSEPILAKEAIMYINKTQVHVNDIKFINDNSLSLKLNNETFTYNKTSTYKDSVYFQCINRKKGVSTNNKCLAKAKYDKLEKNVEVANLHNPNCSSSTQQKLAVNEAYKTQKELLINKMSENKNLSVVNAINLLRDKNIEASPQSKKFPLNYQQVKKIVKDFRQENLINSSVTFSDPSLLRTVDGSIFRRCHHQHNMIYKSKKFHFTFLI